MEQLNFELSNPQMIVVGIIVVGLALGLITGVIALVIYNKSPIANFFKGIGRCILWVLLLPFWPFIRLGKFIVKLIKGKPFFAEKEQDEATEETIQVISSANATSELVTFKRLKMLHEQEMTSAGRVAVLSLMSAQCKKIEAISDIEIEKRKQLAEEELELAKEKIDLAKLKAKEETKDFITNSRLERFNKCCKMLENNHAMQNMIKKLSDEDAVACLKSLAGWDNTAEDIAVVNLIVQEIKSKKQEESKTNWWDWLKLGAIFTVVFVFIRKLFGSKKNKEKEPKKEAKSQTQTETTAETINAEEVAAN